MLTKDSSENYLLKILKNLSLSELEAKVFLKLLEIGNAPVSKIAAVTGCKRTNTYNILKNLQQQSLVHESARGSIKYFHAVEPQRLLDTQKQKIKKAEESLKALEEILPKLEYMQNPSLIKPRIRFYQGKEGIGNLLAEILESEEFDAYFNAEVAFAAYPDIVGNFIKKLNQRHAKIRELLINNNSAKTYLKSIKNPNHYGKILPKKYNFISDNIIFGDQVAYLSYHEESVAVVIESKDIAYTQKQAFQIMWESC